MLQNHPLKILVLSSFDGRNANVIRDFLFSFNAYSIHDYYYIFDCRIVDENMDFSLFDVVLIFWSLYLPGHELSERARDKIRQSRALKVLFLQDEYRDVRLFNQLMSRLGIQVMFTCVAEKDHDIFYPRSLIPSLQATYTVLTGYVPTYLEAYQFAPRDSRPLDISYRSRIVPYYLGDLGQEKKIIADHFQEIALTHGFKSDISVREQDRIYGNRWVKFMESSRIVLGTPSGASVIDFTGEIRRNCEDYLFLHPQATYEEVKQKFFADVDWKVVIDTVSPRIFETVALGCTMVMHEGDYADILQPGKHYIPVRKDYSNIDEVINQMRDEKYCHQISQQAYRDLVASGEYSYRTFIRRFDQILSRHVSHPLRVHSISKPAFYARNYFKYGESIIPNGNRFYLLPFGIILFSRMMTRELAHGFTVKLQLIMRIPELRRLLFTYLVHQKWISLEPKSVFAELLRFGVLFCLKGKGIEMHRPFRVEISFIQADGNISFKSVPITAEKDKSAQTGIELDADFSISELESAFHQGKIGIIQWDHSSIGNNVYYYRKGKKITIEMDAGRYRFWAISEFAHRFPSQTLAVFRRIVDTSLKK